jgi:hypothetical protein
MIIHSTWQIKFPNYIFWWCHGIVLGGKVKCVAKQSLACLPLTFPTVPVVYKRSKLLSYKVSSKWHPFFLRTKLCNMQQTFTTLSQD